jgi:hypothetical protein
MAFNGVRLEQAKKLCWKRNAIGGGCFPGGYNDVNYFGFVQEDRNVRARSARHAGAEDADRLQCQMHNHEKYHNIPMLFKLYNFCCRIYGSLFIPFRVKRYTEYNKLFIPVIRNISSPELCGAANIRMKGKK